MSKKFWCYMIKDYCPYGEESCSNESDICDDCLYDSDEWGM